MTDLELIFSMLGEASTTEIVKTQNPKGFVQNRKAAKQGGAVAGNARRELESRTGKKVVSTDNYLPEALAISGFTREEHLLFDDPKTVMTNFIKWVESSNSNGRPIFWSDNPAYDWQFINYYTHYYCGKNPFGFSARRIGDLACGLFKDLRYKWKHLRKTKHTHNPVDDSIGNAEALIELIKKIEA